MRRKSVLYIVGLLLMVLPLSGCSKVEGPGGAATIQGKMHIKVYDAAQNLINEYDANKFDVYIIYGDDPTQTYFDDDIRLLTMERLNSDSWSQGITVFSSTKIVTTVNSLRVIAEKL